MGVNTMQDLAETIFDSFGSFLTTLLNGFFNAFIGPLWTAMASAFGLPVT
jgi:hypothetical protein